MPNLIDLPHLASVDKELLATNLNAAAARKLPLGESIQLTRPRGLDDAMYQMLRRFTEPFQVAKTIAEFPAKGSVRALDFTPDGQFLMVVAESVELWDMRSRKLLKSYPCDKTDLTTAYVHSSGECCYLVGPSEIHRLDLATGKVVGRFKPRAGTIAGTAYAKDAASLIVVENPRGAVLVDETLQVVDTYPDAYATSRVAIDSKASEFYLASAGGLPNRHRIDHASTGANPPMLPAGESELITFEGDVPYYSRNGVLQSPSRSGMAMRVNGVFGLEAQASGASSWVVCLRRFETAGESFTVVQDFMPRFGLGSTPTLLPDEEPSCYALCRFGEGIALGYQDKVGVFQRRQWPYASHYDFAYVAADMAVSEEKLDQWELIVTALSRLSQTYDGVALDELEAEFAYRLAMRIAYMPNVSRHVSQWLESGTALSTFVAACHATTSFADSFSRVGDGEAAQRHIESLERLRPDSLSHLFSKLLYQLNVNGDLPRAQSHLVELMNRHPTFILPHLLMAEAYNRRYPENDQAKDSYMLQVAELYPPEWRDKLLARIALADLQIARKQFVVDSKMPNPLATTFKQIVASEYLTEVQLQRLYQFALNNAHADLLESVEQYSATIRAAQATRHAP